MGSDLNRQSFLKIYLFDSTDPTTPEDTLKEGKTDRPLEMITFGLYKINMYDEGELFVYCQGIKNQNV